MNCFKPTQAIEQYINNKDTQALRGIMRGIIHSDPTFATGKYEEALDYISNRLDIWDVEAKQLPGEYKLARDEWNEEYFYKQLAWLSQNFTCERVRIIKEIGKYVFANKDTWGKQELKNFQNPIAQEKTCQSEVGERMLALLIVMLLFVEAGVLTLPARLKAKVIVGIIGGIAIISVVVKLIMKKKN